MSDEPCGTVLQGAEGTRNAPGHGAPAFSLEEPYYSETMLPRGFHAVVDWIVDVTKNPDYQNPIYTVFKGGSQDDSDADVFPCQGDIEPGHEGMDAAVEAWGGVNVEGEDTL
jgi:hypothetical protein